MGLSRASERLLQHCRAMVGLAARIVPPYRRAEWEMEWTGELWHRIEQLDGWTATPRVRRRMLLAASGALLHALWLRGVEWRLRMQDVRYGLRLIARQPGFSLVVLVTLALGIGANAAVFTVVNTVLLKPLPYADPDRLVWMYGSFALNDSAAISPPDFLDYRDRNGVFSSMGAMTIGTGSVTLSGSGSPERVGVTAVSAGLFSTLGVEPLLGRGFRPEEERAGAPRVAVLGYELWRDRFGQDPAVIGRRILLDAEPTIVLGVMPAGFRLPFDSGIGLASDAALWTPIAFGSPQTSVRRFHFLRAIGRLKDGATVRRAQASLDVVARQLEAAYPENESWKLRLVPLYEHVVGPVRPVLLILQAVVALVLLVACANVTSLMLARAESRGGELALRCALGASRGRLLRQLLTESLVLASLGAGLGIALAYWGVHALLPVALAGLPRADELSLSPAVLLFAVSLTALSALACGLAPALPVGAARIGEAIARTGRGSTTSAAGRFQRGLVVGQIVASVVLLVAGGLLVRSLWRMYSVPLGFEPEGIISGRISLPEARYPTGHDIDRFVSELLERLRAEPAVTHAAAISILPLSGADDTAVHPDGTPPSSDREKRYAQVRSVAGDFFRTFGIPVLAGRPFDDRDVEGARQSIVINREMAAQFFPALNPVGRHLVVDLGTPTKLRVIGVVGNIREWGPAAEAPPIMYLSAQLGPRPVVNVAARTALDPARFAPALLRVVRGIDGNLAVGQVQTMPRAVASRLLQPRLRAAAVAGFGGVALALTLIGLYGVLAYSVARRRREIGVRLALGARPSDVLRMIMRQGGTLVALGLALGSLAALSATRFLASLLFEVQPRDPAVLGGVVVLLGAASLLAILIPSIRATRVDPLTTHRNE